MLDDVTSLICIMRSSNYPRSLYHGGFLSLHVRPRANIGTLRKYDGDSNRNVKKVIGFLERNNNSARASNVL